MKKFWALFSFACFAAVFASIYQQWASGQLAAYTSMFCSFGALAVMILTLRDSRGRMSLKTLLLLLSFAALFVWATMLTIQTTRELS